MDGASIGTKGGKSLKSGSRGDAMTPERRDGAEDNGVDALLEDDDDDAGSDGAHLSLTVAAKPGLAASRSRAASIPAICASRRPFGAGPRLVFPLDEGFDGALEDRCCRPCWGGAGMDGRAIFLLGAAGGVGPDDVDAASVRRTSLAPNDVGVFAGVLSSSPVKVMMRDEDEEASAAAVPLACAFSSASLFLFLRRRSLAAFLALFLAFSILLCHLPEGTSAEGLEEDAKAGDAAASSSLAKGGTVSALGKASGGAVVNSPVPFLLFQPLAASGFFFACEEFPVLDAVTGVKRAPIAVDFEAEVGIFPGAVRVRVAAARCSSSFFLKLGTRGTGDISPRAPPTRSLLS